MLAEVADKTGLTRALNVAVGEPGLRAGSHDRGRVIRDLAVMLADGGDCLADLRAVSDQAALFGPTASPSTAFRVIDRIASTPGLLDALRDAHARARARVWELAGAPERLTIDLDATLITAHSEKDQAAGTFKGGYGFAPMLAYGDETGEALAGQLRPGNAGANNAAESSWLRWRLLVLENQGGSFMPAERTAGKPTTRRYSPEEKQAAVRMVRSLRAETGMTHGAVRRVAEQLGYGVESVRSWVKQADIDDGARPGVSTSEAERVNELEQENRELRRANEILRRAATFFGAELDRQQRR